MKCYGQLTESRTHKVCGRCGTVKDADDCAGCPREYGFYLFKVMAVIAACGAMVLAYFGWFA